MSLLPTPRTTDSHGPGTHGHGGLDLRIEAQRTNWDRYTPAITRWEHILGRPAPDPTVPGPRSGRRINPALVEWMMGLPEGHVTAVRDLSHNAQLHALGNGVVPQQAEHALRWLLDIATIEAAA